MSEIKKEDIELVSRLITAINQTELAEDFILDFFSNSEISDLAERWQIAELVSKGTPQRQVRDELKVSLAKVSRSAQILKSERKSFVKVEQLLKRENEKEPH
tara:strand:- start:676 stop:981 length:306 start_codon:yes stop_codon:yes gene_type:complete